MRGGGGKREWRRQGRWQRGLGGASVDSSLADFFKNIFIDQRRNWQHSQREEGREGSLNAEARQPRLDGRIGEPILVLDAEFERGRILREAGRDGRGCASGSQGSRVRAL